MCVQSSVIEWHPIQGVFPPGTVEKHSGTNKNLTRTECWLKISISLIQRRWKKELSILGGFFGGTPSNLKSEPTLKPDSFLLWLHDRGMSSQTSDFFATLKKVSALLTTDPEGPSHCLALIYLFGWSIICLPFSYSFQRVILYRFVLYSFYVSYMHLDVAPPCLPPSLSITWSILQDFC